MTYKKHDIRESSPVEELIGKPPPSVSRWGILVITLIFIMAVFASWIIQSPQIVRGNIVLTTQNPPAQMMAHKSGLLNKLFVTDGQLVKENEYLALIETSADISSVSSLYDFLSSDVSDNNPEKRLSPNILLSEDLDLGELQTFFSSFKASYVDYMKQLEVDHYSKKIDALEAQIEGISDYIILLEENENLYLDRVELGELEYSRASSLKDSAAIAAQELENVGKVLNTDRIDLSEVKLLRKEKAIERESKVQELENLKAERELEIDTYRTSMEREKMNLIGEMDIWFMDHVIRAPISGTVVTPNWGENQNITEGEIVCTVIPEGDEVYIGKIILPMEGSGRVEKKDEIIIKLDGYPYIEFGTIRGRVGSISPMANDDQYRVDVILPEELITNYGRDITFVQNMSGTAEIITEDIRLLVRLFGPIRYIFKRNKLLSED